MRYLALFVFILLLASCANDVEIKDSEIEKQEMEVKTTRIQENGIQTA